MNKEQLKEKFEPFADKKVRITAVVKVGEDFYGVEKTKEKEWVGYIRVEDYLNKDLPVFMMSNARKSFYTLALKEDDVWDGHIFVKKIKAVKLQTE